VKFYKLPVEIASRRDLPAGAKIILAVIADRIGENDSCWPGLRRLGKDAGLSVATVRQSIQKLQVKTLLEVTRQGKGKVNVYSLAKESVQESNTVSKVKCAEKYQTGVQESSTELCKKVAHNQTDQLNQTNILRPNSDAFRLSELLLNLILERKPDFKKPNLQSWSKHIDRMVRLDKRTPERIEAVIRWSQKEPFWQNNILSAEKLRDKFDQLELKMGTSGYGETRTGRDNQITGTFVR
jgi:DNA-binding transcriptional regulator YhcF (GntR family)